MCRSRYNPIELIITAFGRILQKLAHVSKHTAHHHYDLIQNEGMMEPQTVLDIAIRGACIWQVLCFLFVLLRAGFRIATSFSSSTKSSFPHLRPHLLPLELPLPTVLHPVVGAKRELSLISLPPEVCSENSYSSHRRSHPVFQWGVLATTPKTVIPLLSLQASLWVLI